MGVGAHSCLERLVTLDTDQEIRVPIPYVFSSCSQRYLPSFDILVPDICVRYRKYKNLCDHVGHYFEFINQIVSHDHVTLVFSCRVKRSKTIPIIAFKETSYFSRSHKTLKNIICRQTVYNPLQSEQSFTAGDLNEWKRKRGLPR